MWRPDIRSPLQCNMPGVKNRDPMRFYGCAPSSAHISSPLPQNSKVRGWYLCKQAGHLEEKGWLALKKIRLVSTFLDRL